MPNVNGPGSLASNLAEIARLCEGSLDACRLTQAFFNTNPRVASLEIDLVATAAAGEDIFTDKPTQGLLRHLAALRALDGKSRAIGDTLALTHGLLS